MTVVYAIADLHGQLPPIPRDAELLLIGGDVCPDFRPSVAESYAGERVNKGGWRQAQWLDVTFRDWLTMRPAGCEVVGIWGNHDFVGEKPDLVPDLPWTLLQDSEAIVKGLRIYGTPGVPGLPYWAFYVPERALQARADQIPKGLDILLSHGPPRGAGDFVPTNRRQVEKYGNEFGERVGDAYLAKRLLEVRPKITVCGHIHEDRGAHEAVGTRDPVANVAAVDGCYDLYPNPFVRLYQFG